MTAEQVLNFLLWMQGSDIDLSTIDVRVYSQGTQESAPLLGDVNVTMTDDPKGGVFAFVVP